MKKGLRYGLIGAGHMGRYHANVLQYLPEICFSGVYDSDPAVTAAASAQFGVPGFSSVDELLSVCDAVSVAVPTGDHYGVAGQALRAGVHVLVEKPLAATVEQAEALVNLALQQGLVLQVGHIERFNGAIRQIKHIIDRPYLIEARRLAPYNDRIRDVGVVLDLMIHDIDIVLQLVGSELRSVQACGQQAVSEFEDVASAQLQFSDGTLAVITASRVTDHKIRTLGISQPDGYIFLDYDTQDIRIHRRVNADYRLQQQEIRYSVASTVERVFIHHVNPLQQELVHFINCAAGLEQPLVENSDDVRTLQVAYRILEQIGAGCGSL